jgi:DNA-directed RNA polymerase subunit E'/Rpb7
VPPGDFGVLCIPDSVEIVCGFVANVEKQGRVIRFGRESHVLEIDLKYSKTETGFLNDDKNHTGVFVAVGEDVLRRFRCRFECP